MPKKRGRKKAVFKMRLRVETIYSLASLAFFAVAVLIILSFTARGVWLEPLHTFLKQWFGFAAILTPFLFISAGFTLTGAKWSFAKPQVLLGGILLIASVCGMWEFGQLGVVLFQILSGFIQPVGAYVVFLFLMVAAVLIISDTSIRELFHALFSHVEVYSEDRPSNFALPKFGFGGKNGATAAEETGGFTIRGGQPQVAIDPKDSHAVTPSASNAAAQKNATSKPADHKDDGFVVNTPKVAGSIGGTNNPQPNQQLVWQYPPLSLLSAKGGGEADRGNINQNASIIEETLDSFGIKAKVREVNKGPAVTQYALQISLGTKLSKITALANDLALALAAPTGQIRIEAPIPGRNLVGIEIPNRSPEFVTMRTMLASDTMKKAKSKLTVTLGLNVAGQPVVADISKMPHVLIAGATGSGKSVAINSFLASLLFRASPNEVKLILVDPKRVELTGYNDIPHLLTPVIVEPEKVVRALKWAQGEMDRRYKVFAEVGARNIEGYNEMAGFQALPYIVIVIDELADIMLFSPAEVEDSITRLAQMARATGMHLVLATQRPSVDVITGLIKANIPARIAFNVSSMMDSRVILDMPGAEKLLGRGDMLYIPPDQAKPTRIQGTFVSDGEIRAMIQFIKQNGEQPQYQEEVLTKFQSAKAPGAAGVGGNDGSVDQLFIEAVKIIIEYDKASASVLQRRFSIGYNRAARIVDQMYIAGIVGPPDGSKPRDVNREAAKKYLEQNATG